MSPIRINLGGNRIHKRFAVAILLCGSLCVEAAEYLVRKGDTLSEIAARQLGGPIYGEKGAIHRILALNPSITDPNRVSIGQKLALEAEPAPVLATTEAPPASRAPAAEAPPVVEVRDPNVYGIITVSPNFESTAISATDNTSAATAKLLSKSNAGVSLSYAQRWSQSFETEFFFGLKWLKMAAPQSGSLLNDSPTLSSYGVRACVSPNQAFHYGAGVTFEQAPFLKGVSVTEVTLDALTVPTLHAFAGYDFLARGPFTLGVSADAGLGLPTDSGTYQTKTNPSYGGDVHVRQDISHSLQAEIGLGARVKNEDTNLVKQSETDYGIALKLRMPIGGSF